MVFTPECQLLSFGQKVFTFHTQGIKFDSIEQLKLLIKYLIIDPSTNLLCSVLNEVLTNNFQSFAYRMICTQSGSIFYEWLCNIEIQR